MAHESIMTQLRLILMIILGGLKQLSAGPMLPEKALILKYCVVNHNNYRAMHMGRPHLVSFPASNSPLSARGVYDSRLGVFPGTTHISQSVISALSITQRGDNSLL
ncbi:hypothetical protein DFH27DRAFT_536407 [Peziza echinospora]|nr:hypothetical protein DFH27DRAFT_536407 [Peziza echinospora]